MEKEVILIKEGEIALKGLNRREFENQMVRNIKEKIRPLGHFSFSRGQSTFAIELEEGCDIEEVKRRMKTAFGIAVFSVAKCLPKQMDELLKRAPDLLSEQLLSVKTFKVKAKRSDKTFPLKSPEIERELGHSLLCSYPHLTVDVHNPQVTVMAEVRDRYIYLYAGREAGAGGIPVGCSGKGLLLLSGGIDSPVAGYLMAKRGMSIHAIHFMSPPYTSDRALQKVKRLAEIMGRYCGPISFSCVPFTKMQEAIKDFCAEEYFTILMRRFMMEIAQRVAKKDGVQALITGESLGQVASQTIGAMVCTDAVCEMPVLRPLIGLDKQEIVEISQKIGAFETSILPYEDCCTVFTPPHPRTKPKLEKVLEEEASYNFAPLLDEAVEGTETFTIYPDWQW